MTTNFMENALDANWTAAQVMKTYPETVAVFLDLKTDCIGCLLARFCSLNEVAASYQLPSELLLAKLCDAIKTNLESLR